MSVRPFYALDSSRIKLPAAVLRAKSLPIDWTSDDVEGIVCDLVDTFRASKISVGLAAVQIGILKRIFVMNVQKSASAEDMIFINPKIVSLSGGSEVSYESCMSLPNLKGRVRRKKKISIEYFDRHNKKHIGHFSGFAARVIQHETDHLDGTLCLDHIEEGNSIESADYLSDDNYPIPPIYE